MKIREEIKREEDMENNEPMCMPCCSNRSYTSGNNHLGFFLSAALSGTTIPISMLLFTIASFMSEDDEIKDLAIKTASTLGGMGTVSLGAAISFFCWGTKKNKTPDEEANLIQGLKKNSL